MPHGLMLRFSIRDVLWFTVVVAIVVAWRIEHRSDVQRADNERMVHAIQAREIEGTMRAAGGLRRAGAADGCAAGSIKG